MMHIPDFVVELKLCGMRLVKHDEFNERDNIDSSKPTNAIANDLNDYVHPPQASLSTIYSRNTNTSEGPGLGITIEHMSIVHDCRKRA